MLPAAIARSRYRVGTTRRLLFERVALRRAAKRSRTPDAIVDAAFTVRFARPPITPRQVRSEIVSFVELVRRERPRRFLEIGTLEGGTLYLFAWASAPDARILSVDKGNAKIRERVRFYRSFAGRRQRVEVLLADSHEVETRDAAVDFFEGEPIDVLFIDGDHSYDGVRQDYELYGPLVRPGGLIAFHDIVDGTKVGGVPRFWRELTQTTNGKSELVESWSQDGCGIGLLRRQDSPSMRT